MRYIFLVPIVFLGQILFAIDFEVKVMEGRIWVQKYDLSGKAVFNDKERDKIIANSVDTGTGIPKISDFVLVKISTHVLSVVEDLNNEGRISSRSQAIEDIETRMSEDYNLKKMAESESLLLGYESLKVKGVTVTKETIKETINLEKYKGRKANPL